MSTAAEDKSTAADKRAKARAAMEGDKHKTARVEEAKSLAERRAAARLAMEGTKHKAERETKEKAAKELAASKLRLIEDLDKERQKNREAEQAKRDNERTAEEKAWQEKSARLAQAEASKSVIENLVKDQTVNLSPIRTFKQDLAQMAKSDSVSVEKIIIQEKERAKNAIIKPSPVSRLANINWRLLSLALGVLIVLAIAGTTVYIFWPSSNTTTTIRPLNVTSIILANEKREINTTGLSPDKLVATLSRQYELIPVPEDAVTQFYFVEGDGASRQLLSFNNLIDKLALDLPLTFTRALDQDFMLGLYRSREPAGFFLFTASNGDALRAAMLSNEKKIIGELFRPLAGREVIAKAETAKVRDAILNNVDVRIFSDTRGQTVFVYGFVANELLIITENESAFTKIFKAYRP